MKIVKLLLTLTWFAICGAAFAGIDDVVVAVKYKDGTQKESVEKLKQVEPNVWRFQKTAAELENLETLEVRNDWATAKKGDAGYFITPDSQMGTFRADDGECSVQPIIPVFGVKSPKGCFVAITKGMRFEYAVKVRVKGGEYEIFPRFAMGKNNIPGGKAYEDLIIDFYKLDGKNANYGGMGRTYRKYQLDRGAVKPLRERVKDNPQLKNTVESIFVRVKCGIKDNHAWDKDKKRQIEHQTPENEPKLLVMHDYNDCMRIISGIKALGVDDVEMCLVGWNAGGFDGRYPQVLPIPQEFGGEAKLRETIKLSKDCGYQITNHMCTMNMYEISSLWDEDCVARRADGKMFHFGLLAGGLPYIPCQKRFNEKILDRIIGEMKELGFEGTFHNDVYTCVLPWPCFDPRHPRTRADTAVDMGAMAERFQKAFGGFGSEASADSFAGNLDFVLYVWAYPNHFGKKSPLLDKGPVPLWQIVYHGIILSNPYWDTVDPTRPDTTTGMFAALGDKWKKVLKMAELNGRPIFYFYNFKDLNIIKEADDLYKPMKRLQYEFIDDHKELAPEVFLTKFSDGTRIVTNYSDADFKYKGELVGARAYKMFEPKARTAVSVGLGN